jgi:hypothetical protein
MTLSINGTQPNNALPCAERRYAECHVLFTIVLSDFLLNVVLSVVAPYLPLPAGARFEPSN